MARITKADRTAIIELAAKRFSDTAAKIAEWHFQETDKEIKNLLENYDASELDARLKTLLDAANKAADDLNQFLYTEAKGHSLGQIDFAEGWAQGAYLNEGYSYGRRGAITWAARKQYHRVNENSPHVSVHGTHYTFMPNDVLRQAKEIVEKRAEEQKIMTYEKLDEAWGDFQEKILLASIAGEEVKGLLDTIPMFEV